MNIKLGDYVRTINTNYIPELTAWQFPQGFIGQVVNVMTVKQACGAHSLTSGMVYQIQSGFIHYWIHESNVKRKSIERKTPSWL